MCTEVETVVSFIQILSSSFLQAITSGDMTVDGVIYCTIVISHSCVSKMHLFCVSTSTDKSWSGVGVVGHNIIAHFVWSIKMCHKKKTDPNWSEIFSTRFGSIKRTIIFGQPTFTTNKYGFTHCNCICVSFSISFNHSLRISMNKFDRHHVHQILWI